MSKNNRNNPQPAALAANQKTPTNASVAAMTAGVENATVPALASDPSTKIEERTAPATDEPRTEVEGDTLTGDGSGEALPPIEGNGKTILAAFPVGEPLPYGAEPVGVDAGNGGRIFAAVDSKHPELSVIPGVRKGIKTRAITTGEEFDRSEVGRGLGFFTASTGRVVFVVEDLR